MNAFLDKLGRCMTTTEILDMVLDEAAVRELGISAIRYYRVREFSGRSALVSVDCAGHEAPYPNRLRAGLVEKLRAAVPRERRTDGSFDVIDRPKGKPIIFQIDPRSDRDELVAVHQYPIPFYILKSDDCDAVLGPGGERAAWADVPLTMAGRVLGKLSCSLETGRFDRTRGVPKSVVAGLLKFQDMVSVIAPYLESLRAFDVNSPLEEASLKISVTKDYDELYWYIVNELRHLYPFKFAAADILVVSTDTIKLDPREGNKVAEADAGLLVLRNSSFATAIDQKWVNTEFYRRTITQRPWLRKDGTICVIEPDPDTAGQGLTPWVWRHNRALRLDKVDGDPLFKQQLLNYAPPDDLVWRRKVLVDQAPESLLIVPIPDPESPPIPGEGAERRGVLGVIRFVNREGGRIEPREEVLLRRIAERCVGPKLKSLRYEMFTKRLTDKTHGKKIILMRPDKDYDEKVVPEVSKQLTETVEFMFPTEGKVFLLNRLTPDKRGFVSSVVHSTLPEADKFRDHIFPLDRSLTGYVLGNTEKDFVFVNDLAYAESRGFYCPVLPEIRCALASAIRYDREDYGAFVILSDRYDIIPGAYGKLLTVLAQQLGQLIKRMEISDFSAAAVKGVGHDVPTIHDALAMRLASGACTPDFFEGGLAYASSLIRAYSVTGPPDPKDLQADPRGAVDVGKAIQHAAEMALLVASTTEWTVRPWHECFAVSNLVPCKVAVQPNYLDACLFNLLKNAVSNCSRVESIRVETKLEESPWRLVVQVSNLAKRPLDNTPEEVVIQSNISPSRSLPIGAFFQDTHPRHFGIRLVRSLARWHAVYSNDVLTAGDLVYNYDTSTRRATFTLSIPLCKPPVRKS